MVNGEHIAGNQGEEVLGDRIQDSLSQQSKSLELKLNRETKEMKGTICSEEAGIISVMKLRKSEEMVAAPQEADMLELMAIIRKTLEYEVVNEQLSEMQFELLYQELTDFDKQRRLEDYTLNLLEEQLEKWSRCVYRIR